MKIEIKIVDFDEKNFMLGIKAYPVGTIDLSDYQTIMIPVLECVSAEGIINFETIGNMIRYDTEFREAKSALGVDPRSLIGQKNSYDTSPSVSSEEEIANKWNELRQRRNLELYNSDWTQVVSDLDAGVRQAWATYRQELRDLPQNTIDPAEVVFPVVLLK